MYIYYTYKLPLNLILKNLHQKVYHRKSHVENLLIDH